MTSEPEINVEEIMQQIRAEILAQRAAQTGRPAVISTGGRRFSPEFYEHLYQAGLAYDQIKPRPFVRQPPIPLIGPLLAWARQKVHELVLFYVNQLAAEQIKVNTHLLHALNVLSQDLEREQTGQTEALLPDADNPPGS